MKAGDRTKERFLKAGLRQWPNVSPSSIAFETGYTHAAVLYHFPNNSLKNAIADYAIKTNNSRVILQLIADGHKATKALTRAERLKHFKSI